MQVFFHHFVASSSYEKKRADRHSHADTKNPPIFPEIDGILCHALSLSVSVVLASFDFLLYRSVHERKRKKKELEDEEEEDPHIVTPSKREENSENPILLPKATFP